MVDSKLDGWLQSLSLLTMVALALSLLGVGVALYAPRAEARDQGQMQRLLTK